MATIQTGRFGVVEVKRFFAYGSLEHTLYGQGEPDAVVFEDMGGSIFAVFSDSDSYDQAVAVQDEWEAAQPEPQEWDW